MPCDRLFFNKVWSTIEFEAVEDIAPGALDGLVISGVYAAQKDFTFKVTDGALKISYPEGATVQELLTAWERWKEQAENELGKIRTEWRQERNDTTASFGQKTGENGRDDQTLRSL